MAFKTSFLIISKPVERARIPIVGIIIKAKKNTELSFILKKENFVKN